MAGRKKRCKVNGKSPKKGLKENIIKTKAFHIGQGTKSISKIDPCAAWEKEWFTTSSSVLNAGNGSTKNAQEYKKVWY